MLIWYGHIRERRAHFCATFCSSLWNLETKLRQKPYLYLFYSSNFANTENCPPRFIRTWWLQIARTERSKFRIYIGKNSHMQNRNMWIPLSNPQTYNKLQYHPKVVYVNVWQYTTKFLAAHNSIMSWSHCFYYGITEASRASVDFLLWKITVNTKKA
jgi:hypothetical protein